MNKIRISVITVSLFVLIFQIGIYLFSESLLYSMFAISPFLMAWMIYTVLRFGKSASTSFDDKFYEDHSYNRNGKEGLNTEAEDLFTVH